MDSKKLLRNNLKKAVLIVGHGSKLRGFQAAMTKLAGELRKDKALGLVSCAYLEITQPSVSAAIDTLVKKGAGNIRVLPYFLLFGKHIKEDLPRIVKAARQAYKGRVRIKLYHYLGYSPKIVSVVKQRLREG